MNREGHNNVQFFTGTEVERTPAFGKQTLFVVGVQPVDEIAHHFDMNPRGIEHIFFGANHSFHPDPDDHEEWQRWESMITHFLEKGYMCSLDIPIKCVEAFNDTGLCEYRNFVPQIRVSIPYIRLWNYNTMIKLDDNDFDATNPGVWTHSLHSLMSRRTFTDWDQYNEDSTL
jgi:hypothetical protein